MVVSKGPEVIDASAARIPDFVLLPKIRAVCFLTSFDVSLCYIRFFIGGIVASQFQMERLQRRLGPQ